MVFGIRIRSETGKIIYDSNEKVTCFLGSRRVQLTDSQIQIPIPGQNSVAFVRVDADYDNRFSRFYLKGYQKDGVYRLFSGGSPEPLSAVLYFFGTGTTGIKPRYGAVVYDENRNIIWSSLDTPLYLSTVSLWDAAVKPGTRLIAERSCATTGDIFSYASSEDGYIECHAVGFRNGLYTTGKGDYAGDGSSLKPAGGGKPFQPYINTAIFD
ncbi:hypothetical protein G3601_002496 [Salmonella enterica]|uniref:Uncharacterized protein n=3 Tax=Salmonella enterica TaxID=28901 RepID=A0A3Y9C3H1_SALEB|nr:hypothetical protein [Salmonella enterica subsp. enterica serovar Java]EAN9725287.1 hypothetical protein [Salmonella enterica]EBV8393228.1 hypothetical protein [Salmonella enterica subsp. enterica serovar Virchow]EDQ0178801.1 hypothetical protein [Salmonella enterica subsp. enterica serovar 4,[5],12:b:-]EDV9616171.1 hypothetical protein [Salmonella enterica subsp. enterica serovar Paratyphi B]EEE5611129.1 hypothetical protein [Salmonella enterica subsp. enterica serovar Typhimurium]EIK6738